MPGWHQAAQQWVADDRLSVVGIVQEQHPERCRLFAQWQGFDWPILHDPINVLKATGVPIVVAIDEQGIVRAIRPRPESFERDFLQRTFPEEVLPKPNSLTPSRDIEALRQQARASERAESWRQLGDSLSIWQAPRLLDEAIAAYQQAIRQDPGDLDAQFRLGVCYRVRHETEQRHAGDFSQAIESWEAALAGRPNQYIWRRRIQQYGPRLMKPYPFYDWVTTAQAEIRQRGETPVLLRVVPSGAEIAHPSRQFRVNGERVIGEIASSPDPNGAIRRDSQSLVEASITVVPTRVEPGKTARVHVTLSPRAEGRVHWNNEAEPLRLWVDPPDGWQVTTRSLTASQGQGVETNEIRRLDFEVQVPSDATVSGRLSAFALYYVCEDLGGTCLFLRKDIPIEILIEK